MKRIFLGLIFTLISLQVCLSQAFTISDINSLGDQYSFEKSKMNTLGGIALSSIDGSPYLLDEFVSGKVIIDDSVLIERVPLRYNIYSDKMEFRNAANQVLEIASSTKHYRFHIGNQTFVNRDYTTDGVLQEGIFERLAEGKISLYKKYGIEFKEASKAIGFQDAEPNRFIRTDDEFYVSIDQNTPVVIDNVKRLAEMLMQYKPSVEEYLQQEKPKLKKEHDLIRLIQYCNE